MNLPDRKTLSKIKMAIFDIDGVFTDGSVYLDMNGNEMMKFSRIDGKGIELLNQLGIIIAVISSEKSEIYQKRMRKLKISEIHLGIKDKLTIFNNLISKYSLSEKEICYCGDDIQDIPVLKKVGFSCCPKNAQNDVKDVCDYISTIKGGNGFVREICNLIIKSHV